MAIDTLENAHRQYLENADYDAASSVAKAGLFLAACRALIALQPDESRADGESIRFNVSNIRAEAATAAAWIARRRVGSSGRVRRFVRSVE